MAEAILIVATVASAGAQIAGGISAKKASDKQAEAERRQGILALQEAEEQAERERIEGDRFRARQKMMFIASGVDLAGSPLLVLEDTRIEIEKRVESILRRGRAEESFFKQTAESTTARGKAALVQGLGGAFQTVTKAQKEGVFKSGENTKTNSN